MKKISLVLFLLILLSCPICYAETQTVITEGTYTMTDNDTPAQAEQAAILNAKRAALEQVGTFVTTKTTVDIGQLKAGQIKELSAGVIKSEVLEQVKKYDGQNMIYWVKIKSEVKMDNLSEAIAAAIKATEKKVVGVIVTFDTTTPADKHNMDDLRLRAKRNDKYNYADLEKDNNLLGPIKMLMSEKYGSRYATIEFVKDIPTDLSAYAKEKAYNYVILSTLKFNKLQFKTNWGLFSYDYAWIIDGECAVRIYNADTQALTLNKMFNVHSKMSQPGGLLNISIPNSDTQFNECIVKFQNDLIGQMRATLPAL